MTLQDYAVKNKSLFWDIPHPEKLSELAIQERFMQYGNWRDIRFLEREL